MIFRDDDIAYRYNVASQGKTLDERFTLERFKRIDELFMQYKVPHTITVIAKDLEKATELVEYIKANRHIVVQLHCWEHIDFTKHHHLLHEHFALALDKIQSVLGVRPTLLYPPWNRSDAMVEHIAAQHGLTVSTKKISTAQFVNAGGDVKEETINFHYWADEDVCQLEECLKLVRSY